MYQWWPYVLCVWVRQGVLKMLVLPLFFAAGLGSLDAWRCLQVVTSFFFFWSIMAWLALAFSRNHKR